MTVTVEAGATLAALNQGLAKAGQYLPLDPPLPSQVTVGGLIAADQWGPWRASQGKVRDLLIGITVALDGGRIVHGGGRVVKNVAGYDLMKLFTGSWGTLGVVVEATFKVRPLPAAAALFRVPAADLTTALSLARRIVEARLSPAYLTVLNRAAAQAIAGEARPLVLIACAGIAAEIEVQRQRLIAVAPPATVEELGTERAVSFYESLRDWPATAATWGARLSLLPSRMESFLAGAEELCGAEVAIAAHHLSGVAILRGAAPIEAQRLHQLRSAVRRLDGYAIFDRLPPAMKAKPPFPLHSSRVPRPPIPVTIDVWGEQIPGLELMRGVKRTLDPQRRLSPGRFVGGI